VSGSGGHVIRVEQLPTVRPLGGCDTGTLKDSFGTKTAARFLSASLVYAYVERKQIPHFRMMGRSIRFRLSELDQWRQQFHVNGGINE
jgi:excisionase family DNA binding protein